MQAAVPGLGGAKVCQVGVILGQVGPVRWEQWHGNR